MTLATGYSRRDNSTSSSSATPAQSMRLATRARRKQFATADFPHPTARASWRQLPTPPSRCKPQHIFDLLHCKPRLGHPFAPFRKKKGRRMEVYTGSRRFGRARAVSPRAAHAGHQSGMPDSVPLQPQNCPRCQRNTVRHHSGMLSAFSPESCPSWSGLRISAGSSHSACARPISRTIIPDTPIEREEGSLG